jgi:hypothetical protein
VTDLDRECDVFCRYLTGRPATAYVREKYRAFHQAPEAAEELQPGTFDGTLVAAARLHPTATRLADAYAAFARPGGTLRKKLVLLVAVLEACAPDALRIDEPSAPPGVGVWVALAAAVAAGGLTLAAAAAVFAPWHAVAAASAAARRRRRALVPTPRVNPVVTP